MRNLFTYTRNGGLADGLSMRLLAMAQQGDAFKGCKT